MKKAIFSMLTVAFVSFVLTVTGHAEDNASKSEKELDADLALLQGSWELLHGNDGKGKPDTRSIKTIKGNTETLRRYSIATGKLTHEHSVEFKLSTSGNVRVLTFFPVGDSPENGASYIYKVDKHDFFDVPGLLHGTPYFNYQARPAVWNWKRVVSEDPDGQVKSTTATSR